MDLVADNLLKSYGKRTVVDHVSFRVAPGEVVGLLGPNGAGKTTSFYAVVGLVAPDGGKCIWAGMTSRATPCTFGPKRHRVPSTRTERVPKTECGGQRGGHS